MEIQHFGNAWRDPKRWNDLQGSPTQEIESLRRNGARAGWTTSAVPAIAGRQCAAGDAVPSLTLRRISASGTAAAEISIKIQNTSM